MMRKSDKRRVYRQLRTVPAEFVLPADEAERLQMLSRLADEALEASLRVAQDIVTSETSRDTHKIQAINAINGIARTITVRRRMLGATESLSVTLPQSLKIQVSSEESSTELCPTHAAALPSSADTGAGDWEGGPAPAQQGAHHADSE